MTKLRLTVPLSHVNFIILLLKLGVFDLEYDSLEAINTMTHIWPHGKEPDAYFI